jgi:hypothetical protein
MVAWILTISFLLHGVALLLIVLLYTRFSALKKVEQTQSAVMKDMEEVVSAYLMEMKEQNDEFIQRFEQQRKQSIKKGEQSSSLPSPNISVFDEVSKPSEQNFLQLAHTDLSEQNVQEERAEQIEAIQTEDLNPEQIKHMALSLQKKGLTTQEIAKSLHRGKTEIELLLTFNKNL